MNQATKLRSRFSAKLYSQYRATKTKVPGSTVSLLTCTEKMPCPSFSLPAGKSCPNAHGSVCASCYACKGMYMFPNVVKAQATRFAWTIECMRSADGREEFVSTMIAAIKLSKSAYFRGHDSGDFFSVAYLECWIEVCKRMPEVSFWFPTREYQSKASTSAFVVINPRIAGLIALNALSNVTVRPSALEIGQSAPVVPGLAAGSAVSDESAHQCMAPTQDSYCFECRACWTDSSVAVSYHLH